MGSNVGSQNNIDFAKQNNGLEQFHSICGIFHSYDLENQILNISYKDSIISFRVSEYIVDLDDYDSLLKSISVWESNKESISMEIEYFAVISYNSNSQTIEFELFHKSFKLCKPNQIEGGLYNYLYEKNIKTITGKLVRVEIGDYLHVKIQSEDGELHSFWVYYDIGEETEELLYSKADQSLNDNVRIKYCNTVGYVAEVGKPMLMNTCIEIVFE